MPPSLFDVPSVPQVDTIRVLWMVSYHMLTVMSTRRYLTATWRARYKCGDWYTNVFLRSTDEQYRSYMRLSRTTFEHVLSLLRAHAGEIFVSGRGTPQLSLEIQLAIALYRFGHYVNASRVEAVADQFGVSVGLMTLVK